MVWLVGRGAGRAWGVVRKRGPPTLQLLGVTQHDAKFALFNQH